MSLVSERTALLVIGTRRASFDSLLRRMTNVKQATFWAGVGIAIFAESLRWVSNTKYVMTGSPGVYYVPADQWAQVLSALDELHRLARDTPVEKLGFVNTASIVFRMPVGYRNDVAGVQAVEVPSPAPALQPITTGGGGGGADPVTGSLQTGGDNLDQATIDSSTPVTVREDNVITLPVANSDPLDNLRPPAEVTTTGVDPKLKMVGFAAAGLLGAFLLVKLAK